MDLDESNRIKSSKFMILDDPQQLKKDIQLPPDYMGRALIYLDIDDFKQLNSRYNETKINNTILREFQKLLFDIVTPFGYVYAEGGDEVIIMLNNCSAVLACAIAENIRNTLEQKQFYIEENTHQITVSMGIAHSNDHETPDLQEKANEAKQVSKQEGRNRTSIALPDRIEYVHLQPLFQSQPKRLVISSSKLKEMRVEDDSIIAEYISKPDPFYLNFYCARLWEPNPFFRALSSDPELFEQLTSRLSKSKANQIPKVHRSIILLKALDVNNQPLLLHYRSERQPEGWMTWLLPNIDREIVNSKENFLETMADYLRTLLGLTKETITIHNLNTLSVCLKTNRHALKPEIKAEPKFYAFRYYYATLNNLPEQLLRRSIIIPQGNYFRHLRWFHLQELSCADDNKMFESNADVINTIYKACGASLSSIPEASTKKLIAD